MSLNDCIDLNVGGRHFETTRHTLLSHPDFLLAKIFSLESSRPLSTVSPDGAFRIDVNPDAFAVILDWLRTKKLIMNDRTNLENVAIEAEAFGVLDLKYVVEERKKEIKEERKKEINVVEWRKEIREELKNEIREELKKEINVDEWMKEIKVEERRKKDNEDELKKEDKEAERRKEVKEKRRNAKKEERSEEQKTTLTQSMSKLNKIRRSFKLDRVIRKKKILPKPMLKKNLPIFTIRKSAKPVPIAFHSNEVVSPITYRNQPSVNRGCDKAGRVKKAIAAPPTRKPKEPKMDNDVEVVEFNKRHNNQEVTEAVPKVIKNEVVVEGTDDETKNRESLDIILCGICFKPFSKNAGALVAHGETHGSQFGGKGKRKCTQGKTIQMLGLQ